MNHNNYLLLHVLSELSFHKEVRCKFSTIRLNYNKGYNNQYSKARYDKNLKYIPYNKMFFPGAFKGYGHFKENNNIINSIKQECLKKILTYSVKIFEKLNNLVYCSIDWLYDPLSGDYAFCELTPTPFVLSKPVKTMFSLALQDVARFFLDYFDLFDSSLPSVL